jgi:hypothetical protein
MNFAGIEIARDEWLCVLPQLVKLLLGHVSTVSTCEGVVLLQSGRDLEMEHFVLRVIWSEAFIKCLHFQVSHAADIAQHSLLVLLRELIEDRLDYDKLEPQRGRDPHVDADIREDVLVVRHFIAIIVIAFHPGDPVGHDD